MNELEILEIPETPPPVDLTPEEIEALAEELVAYHAEFADLFYRVEQAHWSYKYLQGLMLPLERKAIQPMALALEGGNVQAMQQFIGQGRWQDEPVLRKHRHLVDETLGEADGVCIIDGSEFPKKGEHSVGVARQWCGRLGKVENCQAGVFAAYTGRHGYTLLDRRLYLPEEWFDEDHRERWERCEIPEETPFKTKPELALEMVQAMVEEGSPHFRWVTCDEWFGRDPGFLDGVADLDRWYVAEVSHDTRVWLERPRTAVRNGLPGPEVWLIFRHSMEEEPELKVYLSNAPAETPVEELVRVTGMRWPIEMAIEESKSDLGMAHYEVRTWQGWYHHMTECLLAHHFLVRARKRLKRGPPCQG